jgi:hypothetical protein
MHSDVWERRRRDGTPDADAGTLNRDADRDAPGRRPGRRNFRLLMKRRTPGTDTNGTRK